MGPIHQSFTSDGHDHSNRSSPSSLLQCSVRILPPLFRNHGRQWRCSFRASKIPDFDSEDFDSLPRMQEQGYKASEGYRRVTIDSQKQKVTVTGNVQADILIKKLLKMGKRAEIWPEKKPDAPNQAAGVSVSSSSENKPNANNEPAATAAGDVQKKFNEESEKHSSSGGDNKKGLKKTPVTDVKQGTVSKSQLLSPDYHFPACSTQPPAYILSYCTPHPAAGYAGVAHHGVTLHQSSYMYIPSLTSTPTTYELFSEENANACTVM